MLHCYREKQLGIMELCRNPSAALTGEIAAPAHLLVIYYGFMAIIDPFTALSQEQLQFFIEAADGIYLGHHLAEKRVIESHCRPGQPG